MLKRKEKGGETEPGKLATDPKFPCNESFSTQAGFGALLCFYISLSSFFSSCPRLDVERLALVQETVLVAFAF